VRNLKMIIQVFRSEKQEWSTINCLWKIRTKL